MVSTTIPLPRAYLVLGSTGFLGPNIVFALLNACPNIKICCLNRSADGEQRTVSALLAMGADCDALSSRLEFVVADMSKASLGLGQLAAQLASELEQVIFNAWNPNWALPYQRFGPLLEALQRAIHFCAHEAKGSRIVFISSVCAIGNWPRIHPRLPLIPESVSHDSRYAMAHGYGESKAAAERMLAQANSKDGLPVVIMRALDKLAVLHPAAQGNGRYKAGYIPSSRTRRPSVAFQLMFSYWIGFLLMRLPRASRTWYRVCLESLQ